MDKGLGSVTWWGFTPALDLIEHHELLGEGVEMSVVNILLVGGADIRHIIQTLSRRNRHKRNSNLNFYILENNLEVYARDLLLLALSLELSGTMGLQEKTEMFAEIYGNSLVRHQTAMYIQFMANEMVKMVTDFDLLHSRLPFFNLDTLKYKERDMLESIFKLWRKPETDVFDAAQCWDLRVRQHTGSRYDSAKGVFDWDYSMKFCDRDAEIIGSRNYLKWRKTGVAFELREGSYDVPNKTLASGMIFKVEGERIGRRGYWGDIVVSPYITFGIECDEESYFRKANKEYVSNSEQITKHNLTSLFSELLAGERYAPLVTDCSFSAEAESEGLESIGEEEEEDVEVTSSGDKQSTKTTSNATSEERMTFHQLEGVTINFLPLSSLPDMTSKEKYKRLFHIAYFSNSMVHHLQPSIPDILSDDALLILETAKFVTEISKEQYIQFANKICNMAKSVGCQPLVDGDPEKDCFSFHKFHRG